MSNYNEYHIVSVDESFRPTVQAQIAESWAGPFLAVNGKLWDTRSMPGFAAVAGDCVLIGYLLYVFHLDACEIMVLESLRENAGVGTRLIEQLKITALENDMKKVVVTTTNDNLHALRFYQKRGFTLCELRPNILDTSRRLKSGIPPNGIDGIPLRDEIELELTL